MLIWVQGNCACEFLLLSFTKEKCLIQLESPLLSSTGAGLKRRVTGMAFSEGGEETLRTGFSGLALVGLQLRNWKSTNYLLA